MARPPRIGIDLGGTKIEGVVLDATERPAIRKRVPTDQTRGYEHIVGTIAALVADLSSTAPGCELIGLGTPGAVSTRTGRLKNSNTLCLNGQDLASDLGRRVGLPVVVENDANCFALAEAR